MRFHKDESATYRKPVQSLIRWPLVRFVCWLVFSEFDLISFQILDKPGMGSTVAQKSTVRSELGV
jgi:hypothetical protein